MCYMYTDVCVIYMYTYNDLPEGIYRFSEKHVTNSLIISILFFNNIAPATGAEVQPIPFSLE